MILVLTFGVVLLVTVAVSGLAARSVLSTALVFLVAGSLVGPGGLGLIDVTPQGPAVQALADLALFTVLFVDGGRLPLRQLRTGWRLSGRALGLGMPLTLVLVALATHYLVGLDWTTSLLVGAILSPTDPVFASTIVSRSEVPLRLRKLLNIESGLNDGLALPFVLVFLAIATGADAGIGTVALELVLGLVLGVVLPLVITAMFRLPVLGAEPRLQPLGPLALAIILYGLCHLTHANPYLAAFAAGITLATVAPRATHAFEGFGELISELTKFGAVLVFGALLTPTFFLDLTAGEWVVALLALLVVRPASVLVSLWGADLHRRERYAAAWFGPKGFASVVYGLLVVQSGIATAQTVFELVALNIAVSIVAHSMSDVPVAKAFDVEDFAGLPADADEREPGQRAGAEQDRPERSG
ncbi:cation:proton antiporter [Pseudonocardia adelaidensis]|uniref:Cation:proton antiporter n=1 Tax=Pseudonocardia adelaidensis TaxID=648754 RepID=A0ABP9NN87_9PSEU